MLFAKRILTKLKKFLTNIEYCIILQFLLNGWIKVSIYVFSIKLLIQILHYFWLCRYIITIIITYRSATFTSYLIPSSSDLNWNNYIRPECLFRWTFLAQLTEFWNVFFNSQLGLTHRKQFIQFVVFDLKLNKL